MTRSDSPCSRWCQFRSRKLMVIMLAGGIVAGCIGKLAMREADPEGQTLPTPFIGTNNDIVYFCDQDFYRCREEARTRASADGGTHGWQR